MDGYYVVLLRQWLMNGDLLQERDSHRGDSSSSGSSGAVS